jgi:hypothetical protein
MLDGVVFLFRAGRLNFNSLLGGQSDLTEHSVRHLSQKMRSLHGRPDLLRVPDGSE